MVCTVIARVCAWVLFGLFMHFSLSMVFAPKFKQQPRIGDDVFHAVNCCLVLPVSGVASGTEIFVVFRGFHS